MEKDGFVEVQKHVKKVMKITVHAEKREIVHKKCAKISNDQLEKRTAIIKN